LRSEVVVTADVVTVGDFYPDAGALAAVPLFRAPDLGTTGNVPAHLVAERARAAGYAEAGTDGPRSVSVSRAGLTIDADALAQAVATAIVTGGADVKADDLEVVLHSFAGSVVADPAAARPVVIERLHWNRDNGQFTAAARIAAGRSDRVIPLTGTASEMIDVYTLAAPLDRGAVVRASALVALRLPRQRIDGGVVLDRATAVGLAARRSLRSGQPLRLADLEPPTLVGRGEKVTLIYNSAGMTLTAQGQALGRAAKGEIVDVLNLQSRRTVSGTVIGRGQVRSEEHTSELQSRE